MPREIQDIGQFHYDNTINVVWKKTRPGRKSDFPKDSYHIRRAAQRAMEEMVELCLAAGCSTGNVMEAVTDALYNEARKARAYPSQLTEMIPNQTNLTVEIADVEICTDYIRHLADIPRHRVEAHQDTKLQLLAIRARDDVLVMIGGNVYKKSARP